MQLDKQEIESAIENEIAAVEKEYGKSIKFKIINIIGLVKMLQPVQEEKSREIPLTRWNDYYPDPSVKALRMLVFHSDKNGFDKVVIRRGKRILIDENKYFEWRNERRGISNVG